MNSDQSYTIAANEGYHVLDVLVDGVSVGTVTSYEFTNVTSNKTNQTVQETDKINEAAAEESRKNLLINL